MEHQLFHQRLEELKKNYQRLNEQKNTIVKPGNGIFNRYRDPVLTAAHIPLDWKYDLDPVSNPYLMERMGVNAVFNPGAIEMNGKIVLVPRIEGHDRKSFFAVAESDNGIDHFRFWDYPIELPQLEDPDVNVYDMRLTKHEDGWIYGIFCTERKDPEAPAGDTSAAMAQAGIVRTRDLKTWERLPDLKHQGKQQRNVVLHTEFIQGKYALYTRPQDDFISAGSGGGIGWALTQSMEEASIADEKIIDERNYHTIKEVKNGQGPAPIKTTKGWLHLAHGVRGCAAGLRYVLYMFMTSLDDRTEVIAKPGGYLMAPENEERVVDAPNVLFSNGWVKLQDDRVLIYYASSDTRTHVAESSIEQLTDYCIHTPEDPLMSHLSVRNRINLIRSNTKHSQ
ncbi:MAG: glycosidase [Bacteroidales bacterium]|nr:glycosidase [Bacteroidales bacterium]